MDPDLTFLAATCEPNCSIRVDKHLVGYSTIQFMERGGVSLAYDDAEYLLEGAWFWPAHPGPHIKFHAAPGHANWFHRHVGFSGSLVSRWVASGLWLAAPQSAPPGRDYAAFFDELIRQSVRPDRWGRLRAVNLLEQLLLELAEARAQPPRAEESWLPAVLEQLDQPSCFAPDYARIAAAAAMSLSSLRRRFRLATGESMRDHVLQSRLATARTLLAETDLPLKAVSEHLGYDSVYFFARQFRQRVGVTPGLYRKSRHG